MTRADHAQRPWLRRALLLLLLTGCSRLAGASATPVAEPKLLTEAQALLAIQEALLAQGALAGRNLALSLEGGERFEADVHFGTPRFAIEWVTPEERAALGERLPVGTSDGPLQVVSARLDAQPVQVLVLEALAFGYEGNPLLVQRGARGIDEAEQQVRRDVADFVEYVRNQGARP